jgi:hypothetical protein
MPSFLIVSCIKCNTFVNDAREKIMKPLGGCMMIIHFFTMKSFKTKAKSEILLGKQQLVCVFRFRFGKGSLFTLSVFCFKDYFLRQ